MSDSVGAIARSRKLPLELQQRFRDEQFRGVYLASSVIPMPRFVGDNRLGRPIKIGVTKSFEDNLTKNLLGHSPYTDLYVHWRLWVVGDSRVKRLENLLKENTRYCAESIHRGWAHMDGEFDPNKYRDEAFKIATLARITAWSDGAVVKHLEQKLWEEALARALG